jgi:protein-tyrosine phosphatase
MNVLFICSRNKWRSLTAETIYKNYSKITVKSAGTEPSARIKISEKLVNWADIIFVMEKKHKQRLNEKFESACIDKEIIILDIADEYNYMNPELIELLKDSVDHYLEL